MQNLNENIYEQFVDFMNAFFQAVQYPVWPVVMRIFSNLYYIWLLVKYGFISASLILIWLVYLEPINHKATLLVLALSISAQIYSYMSKYLSDIYSLYYRRTILRITGRAGIVIRFRYRLDSVNMLMNKICHINQKLLHGNKMNIKQDFGKKNRNE